MLNYCNNGKVPRTIPWNYASAKICAGKCSKTNTASHFKPHSLHVNQSLSLTLLLVSSCPWAFLLPHGKHLAAPDKRGGSTLNQKSVPAADLSHHEGHRAHTACRLNRGSRSIHDRGWCVTLWVYTLYVSLTERYTDRKGVWGVD